MVSEMLVAKKKINIVVKMPSRQKLFQRMLFALTNILSFDLVVQFIVICCYSMLTFVYEDANNVITASIKKSPFEMQHKLSK